MKGKKLLKWHSWLGLVSGLFVLVMGLSGTILIFHHEIDHVLVEADLPDVSNSTIDLDRATAAVLGAYPKWDTRIVRFVQGETVLFNLRRPTERLFIWVHPETGELLKVIPTENQFTQWLLKFHYSFHAGNIGRILVFVFGLIFMAALITGFYLYRKSIVKTLLLKKKLNMQNRRTANSSIHRTIGVWALFLNFFVVLTGVVLAFQVSVGGFRSVPFPEEVNLETSLNETLAQLETRQPDFTSTYIRLPATKKGDITVFGNFDDDFLLFSPFYNSVNIDAKQFNINHIKRVSESNFGTKLLAMVTPVHFGEFGGLPIKIVYAFVGLSAPILSITGFFIWYFRESRKKPLLIDIYKEVSTS